MLLIEFHRRLVPKTARAAILLSVQSVANSNFSIIV